MRRVVLIFLLSILLPLSLHAQQTGGSVTGHVSDPSGATVGGAKITMTSTTTGAVYTTESDTAGIYRLPFVAVGEYALTAEKPGFKTHVQIGITVVIDEKATVDIKLELGAVSQSVTVTANAPLLQSESADRGWTIGQARIDPMPLAGLNTIMSTWYAPGVTISAAVQKVRNWDTGGMSSMIFNGGQVGNLYLTDGVATNNGGTSNAWNAIDDTVQQVSVQSTMYDAQYGWSSGGVTNTITKGGTNRWHGDAYEYNQNTLLTANTFSGNASIPPTPRLPWHMNFYGGAVGGPIKKNKFFVFYAYQKVWQVQPDPFTTSVPSAAEVQGNFSGLYTSSAKTTQVAIYDPLTTTVCPSSVAWCAGKSSGYARQTISAEYGTNNIIPSGRLNPVAQAVLKFIPPPNNANGYNDAANLVNTASQRKFVDIDPQDTGRADLNLSDKTHAFFRYSMSCLAETRSYIYSTTTYLNPADTSGQSPLFRCDQNYTLQVVRTFNPTTVLEVRTGMNRYENNPGGGMEGKDFDISTLGFSSTFLAEAARWFPQFVWTNYGGAGTSGPTGFQVQPVWTTEAVLAKTHTQHNLRFGFQNYEVARYTLSPGSIAGSFGFTGTYTGAVPTSSSASSGNSIADLLLGDANSGSIQALESPSFMMHQYSLFAQDDYHLSRKLTVNFGLRWDYNGSVTERFNALLRGFCTSCQNPLQVPGMTLMGGPLFAGVGGVSRGVYNPKYTNFGPRFGFAYDLGHNTVLRAGYGMLYAVNFDTPATAPGFSQTTSMVTSVVTGIPNPAVTLQNPFPTGILTPVGSKYGLATNIGSTITFVDPDMNIPRTQQYSLEFQHQLGRNWLFSLGYVGSRGSHLAVTQQLNYLPQAVLPYTYSFGTNPTGLTTTQLNANVANPFTAVPSTSPYYSLLVGTALSPTTTTVAQNRLLVPYPLFGVNGVTENYVPIGKENYNSLQAEFNKRMSNGLDFSFNYTYGKTMQATSFLNNIDPQPSWFISQYDVKQQVKINLAYYLPFGPGKRFLATTNPVVRRLVEGWNYSAVSRVQQGMPIAAPTGVAPTGAPETVPNPTLPQWFNPCTLNASGVQVNCQSGQTPAWKSTVTYQLTTWSPYISQIRKPGVHNVDMSVAKKTTIKEHYDLLFRADFLNAFNSPAFWNGPDTSSTSNTFGAVYPSSNTQSNDQRVIMLSLRFEF
jgi:hypothetical protein